LKYEKKGVGKVMKMIYLSLASDWPIKQNLECYATRPIPLLRTCIPSPNQQNLEFRAGKLGSARPNACCAGEQDAKRRPAHSCGSTSETKSESRMELTMSIDFGTENHEFSTVYRRNLCCFQEA
jgi:hypothetical protein